MPVSFDSAPPCAMPYAIVPAVVVRVDGNAALSAAGRDVMVLLPGML